MALYQHGQHLTHLIHPAFDAIHKPGTPTPQSGIYRCPGCGREVTSVHPHPLPSQNHHQHAPAQGAVRWQLLVCDEQKK